MEIAEELELLKNLDERITSLGEKFSEECSGHYFPCDALVLATISRSVGLNKGFRLLMKEGCYECAAALFRLQLDNVLRIFGVLSCTDPHEVASQLLNGTPLRRIHGKDGRKMTDSVLVEVVSEKNPWIRHAYNLASGFIHLSEQHFENFMLQSKEIANGERLFTISDGDDHISKDDKIGLIRHFLSVSDAVVELANQWLFIRYKFGSTHQLMARFGQ